MDVLEAMDKHMNEHNSSEAISIDVFTSDEYMRNQIELFAELINDYKEDFRLLLFKSAGSSLENYREKIIEKHTRNGIEYISLMKQKYPNINGAVSEFFIHTMSSWWMSIIAELVMHDLSHEALENFLSVYMEFGTAGWKKIMRVNL